MRRHNTIIFIIFSIAVLTAEILFSGCRETLYSTELAAIDSLLNIDPDSAWQRFTRYDISQLDNEDDRHYYALLSAEVHDKTYHEDTAKTAISEAAFYFIEKGDKEKAMRSMFYRGIIYQNSGEYGPAIISHLKSVEMTDTIDHLYRGKIFNAISEIYKSVSDAPQELKYTRLALEEYQKLDSLVFIEDLKLAYGYALCRNNKIDEGINEMHNVYEEALKRNDEERIEDALIYMGLGYLVGGLNDKAKACLSILFSNDDGFSRLKEYDYLYLDTMISAGAPHDSINWIVKKMGYSDSSTMLPFRYYAYNNEYKLAYKTLLEELRQNELILSNRLHSSVSSEVKEHMDEEQNKVKLKISHLHNIIFWVIVSLFLLLCLILTLVKVFIISKRKREKDLLYSLEILTKEKSEIINRIELLSYDKEKLVKENMNIRMHISKLDSDNKNLQDENDSLKREQAAYNKQTQYLQKKKGNFETDLLSKLFGELDVLHAEYYLHGSSEKGKSMLLNHLSNQLTLLREDMDILQSMEGHINNVSNGILEVVYDSVRLNIHQRRIVALLCMGFSKEAVCQIMGIEMSSFYTRMNRLTKRIEASGSPRRNELLILIGRGKHIH